MVDIKVIRPNDLVQYLATYNSSHLKIRIFLSKQYWLSEYSFSLSNTAQGAIHCMPLYITKVNRFFTFAFLWSSFQNPHKLLTGPISYTKAFHKLNTDYAKFLFILNLSTLNSYSEEANNQQHFHAVYPLNNLFLQKLIVVLQLTSGTRQFFSGYEAVFSNPPGYFIKRHSTFRVTKPLIC